MNMRLKIIACKVLSRELALLTAFSNHYLDITTLRQGLHNTPDELRASLQKEIDLIDAGQDVHSATPQYSEDFSAILLGYGLCCNGLVGLSSKRYPLIVPRAHDCITLFLGSREKYQEYFDSHRGVYWYNRGWLENTPMPGEKRYHTTRATYAEHYGEDNADYLMEMEQGWLKEYQWCTFVDWPEFDNASFKKETKDNADFLGWHYDEIQGDKALLERFISGKWEDDFLIVPPGKSLCPSYDSSIIKVSD